MRPCFFIRFLSLVGRNPDSRSDRTFGDRGCDPRVVVQEALGAHLTLDEQLHDACEGKGITLD